MKKIITITMLAFMPLIPMLIGCGGKAIQPESEFDTVISHYDQGMRELEAGRVDKAERDFQRGIGLDKDNPLPYVGMALVEIDKGDRDKAMDYTKDALKRDGKCVPAFLARARVRSAFQEDKEWYKDALEDIEKAKEVDPFGAAVFFTEGMVHESAFQFNPAEEAFAQVLELKRGYEAEANDEMERIHKIKRAAPGTDIGMKIGLVDEITRAETAVLFVEELKLVELLERKHKPEHDLSYKAPDDPGGTTTERDPMIVEATDIEGHWAESYIESVVGVGVNGLTVYPDNKFLPDEHLTRAEYALLMEDILVKLLGDEGLATRFVGDDSPFPDVRADNATFNAISVCVDKGIMKADLDDNRFHPSDTVSGADALLMIKELQDELRTVF